MSTAESQLVFKSPLAIVVMGVSSCGKSSVGESLSSRLNFDFLEGDSFHPDENIKKMTTGIPLNDEDREPWLKIIASHIQKLSAEGQSVVVTCSALKKKYRDVLRGGVDSDVAFVFLNGSKEVLQKRMALRTGHFMPLSLLNSQLNTLETPMGEEGVVPVDIDQSLDNIVGNAIQGLHTLENCRPFPRIVLK